MRYVVGFFIKYLTQQKKNALIVNFRNFGVQKFLQTLKMPPLEKKVKKLKKAEKSKKKLKKSKKWILSKKKLRYKNNKAFYQKSVSLRFLQF